MPRALLVEIGCEEMPARMVGEIARQFAHNLEARLGEAALVDASPASAASPRAQADWTPRRLIARIEGVAEAQPDREERVIGPPVRIGVGADGKFTAQALGFAAKIGAAAADLTRASTPKGEYVAVTRRTPGRPALEVLAELIPQALWTVDLPRSMRWQSGASTRFIRPIRWVAALLGEQSIAVELGGLRAGRQSRGHRTLGAARFELASAADYPSLWEKNHVLAPPPARSARIQAAIARVLGEGEPSAGGLRIRGDAELLDTLVNLTEFPDAVAGGFDDAYLRRLPEEVLVTVMRDHQKYFAVEQPDGRLAARFVAIVNNRADGEAAKIVRHGHERVLRARFNDAQFFFDADRRHLLAERLTGLEAVTFHVALGTYRQKADRMSALSSWMAGNWSRLGHPCDTAQAGAAAELAKCDLTTEMVREFPELQGVMGAIYARAESRPEVLATAIYDHYRPLTAGGELPRTLEGCAVSIADKLDSITGLFAIGETPKGSGDPWALRRQANGILRMLLARELPFQLEAAWDQALAGYVAQTTASAAFRPLEAVRSDLRGFFHERLAYALRESDGLAYDTVNAVLAAGADDPVDALRRARDLDRARRQLPAEFAAIAAALKRMRNIIRKEGGQQEWQDHRVDASLLKDEAEVTFQKSVGAATANRNDSYYNRLLAMGTLAEPLDRFFRDVRVNAEDPALRANRLALLAWAVNQLDTIAHFGEIVVAG